MGLLLKQPTSHLLHFGTCILYHVYPALIIGSPLDQRATLLTKNGTNPYFVSTVVRVKESQVFMSLSHLLRISVFLVQQALSKKASQLDQDIVEARAQAIQHLSIALNVLFHARGK